MLYSPPSHVNERDLYARSPFQVGLLFFVTLGLYVFWWSYRIRRSVAAMLEEPDQPVWNTLGLLVPFLNLFILFSLFEKIKVAALRAGLQPPPALAAWGFAGIIVFVVFNRLPIPYVSLAMLYFIPFAVAHFYFMHAELLLMGRNAIPRGFSALEIIVVILGLGFRGLIMLGYSITSQSGGKFEMLPGAWFAWLTLAGSAIALIVLHRKCDALVSRIVSQSEMAGARSDSRSLQSGG